LWTIPIETFDNRRGVPDVLLCLNGNFIALEFKRSNKELNHARTKMQQYVASLIEESGGTALFIYPENEEECFTIMDRIVHGKKKCYGHIEKFCGEETL
jgi:hypothetical protein